MQAPKVASKQYDTDTDGGANTDNEGKPVHPANPMGLPDESMPHGYKKSENLLDFNNVLKQCGITDLNKLIGLATSSEDEAGKAKQKQAKEEIKKPDMPLPVPPQKREEMERKAVAKRVGLIESIMNENRQA
jgi:hypothetical protein